MATTVYKGAEIRLRKALMEAMESVDPDTLKARTSHIKTLVEDSLFKPLKRESERNRILRKKGLRKEINKMFDELASKAATEYIEAQANRRPIHPDMEWYPYKDAKGNVKPLWAVEPQDSAARINKMDEQHTQDGIAIDRTKKAHASHVALGGGPVKEALSTFG